LIFLNIVSWKWVNKINYYYFIWSVDPKTNVKKVHCPLHDTVGCNANLPALNNSKDLFNFFDHIYRSHPNDRESIKTDYDKWYQEKKVCFIWDYHR
jgi:hypothetical protein